MASTEEEILSTIMPNVLIDKITLFNTKNAFTDKKTGARYYTINSNSIKVVINLVVKEFLTKDIYGTWFDSINIKNYININVVQSKDSKITEALSLAVDMIELVDTTSGIPQEDPRQRALSIITGINSFPQLQRHLISNTRIQRISLNSPSQQSLDITEYPSYVSGDGMTIYEIPYSTTFDINISDGQELQHLAYFVHTSIDLNRMAKDFTIQVSDLKSFFQVTNVVSEIVIDNSEVVSYTNIYKTPDGNEWTGPMHLDINGNWIIGSETNDPKNVSISTSTETLNSKMLTVTKVLNNKIQDFRHVDEINKAIFDFSNLDDLYSKSNLTKIQSFDIKVTDGKSQHLSEIMISRSPNGQSNFSFGLDFYKIMKDNSPYGAYFSSFNDRFKEECIQFSFIRSVKIFRRRIKNNIKKTNLETSYELEAFDQNEPEEIIAISADNNWKQFKNLNNFREIDPELSNDYPNIRFFTATDNNIINKTDGLYQYGIEIDIYDGTLEFIKNKIQRLNDAKVVLIRYYNDCILSDNYNIPSDKFTRKFILETNLKYSSNPMNSPWNIASSVYIDILQMFSSVTDIATTRQIILNYLRPENANPNSITKVIELIEYLVSCISKTANLSVESASTSNLDVNGSMSASNRDSKVFKIVNYFNNYFNANIDKNFGVDVLSDSTVTNINSNGLSKFTASKLNDRVILERRKYFVNQDPNVNIPGFSSNDNVRNASHSYLTPSRFDLVGRSIALNEFLTVSNNNKNQVRFLSEGTESVYQNSLELLMSLLNFKYETFYTNKNSTSSRNRGKAKGLRNASIQVNRNIAKRLNNSISELKGITIEQIPLRVTNNENNMTVVRSDAQRALNNVFSENNVSQESNNSVAVDTIDQQETSVGLKNFLTCLSLPLLTHQKSLSRFRRNNLTDADNSANFSSFDIVSNISSSINNIKSYNVKVRDNQNLANGQRTRTTITVEEIVKQLPNQIKAIFNQQDVRTDKISNFITNTFENNVLYSPMNIVDYQMIVKLEYLDGFEKDSSFPNIKKPIWKMLTLRELESFVRGKELICRLVSYENDKLNIVKNHDLEEILYDRYFLIETERLFSSAVPPAIPERIIGVRDIFTVSQNVDIIEDRRPIVEMIRGTATPGDIIESPDRNIINPPRDASVSIANSDQAFGISPSASRIGNAIPNIRITQMMRNVSRNNISN